MKLSGKLNKNFSQEYSYIGRAILISRLKLYSCENLVCLTASDERYILRCRSSQGGRHFFMASCAFFGHRDMDTEQYREKLLNIIIDLIENKGVDQFYSGYRGDFDIFCSNLIHGLKATYPQIKNTLVLSYIPDKEFILPNCFDDSIYLLERKVPKRLAIIETNKSLVDKADCIVAGVTTRCGGAYSAIEYAHKIKKPIIRMIDDWKVLK